MPTVPESERRAPRWARLAVLCVVLSVIFFQLGGRALNEPDEGRYAEAGREMMATGDWFTPRINGIPHLSKPPLTYWLVGASLRMFGVNEFAARLPAALAALGTLLALYVLVRGMVDEPTALWAVLMLASSALFLLMARVITADMLLTCWVTWSVWALWRRSRWFFVFAALGMLTKGPVAVVLPLFALAGMPGRWREMSWGRGLVVFFLISAPWFVAQMIQDPELGRYFLFREVVQRVASGEHGRSKPWWFMVVALLAGALPWTLPAFGRLKFDAVGRVFMEWAGLGLALFVVSSSKLATYVLPLMPAMAALAAMSPPRRWLNMVSAALLLSLCGLTFYFRLRHGMPLSITLPLDVATVCGAVAAMVAARADRVEAFRGVCVGTLLGVTAALLTLIPVMERNFRHNTSFKFFADRIRQEDPQREAFVVGYFCLPQTLPFYLQESVWFYNPDATNNTHVFEFRHPPPGTPLVISEWTRYREMVRSGRRVFCVTSGDLAETMLAKPGTTWHEVERAGKSVLLTNQP